MPLAMADFHQSGVITTLHRLGSPDLERLERELLGFADTRPIALVLPCLFSELHGQGLKGIVDALRGVPYLRQIVVSISGTDDPSEYAQMRDFFDGVRTLDGAAPVMLWNSGPRVQNLYGRLRSEGLDPGTDGKGRSAWLGYGYVLATKAERFHVFLSRPRCFSDLSSSFFVLPRRIRSSAGFAARSSPPGWFRQFG